MLEAECPDCGKVYYGWIMKDKDQQNCSECGAKLNLKDNSSSGPIQDLVDNALDHSE